MYIFQGERTLRDSNGEPVEFIEGLYISTIDPESSMIQEEGDLYLVDEDNTQIWIEPLSNDPDETKSVIHINDRVVVLNVNNKVADGEGNVWIEIEDIPGLKEYIESVAVKVVDMKYDKSTTTLSLALKNSEGEILAEGSTILPAAGKVSDITYERDSAREDESKLVVSFVDSADKEIILKGLVDKEYVEKNDAKSVRVNYDSSSAVLKIELLNSEGNVVADGDIDLPTENSVKELTFEPASSANKDGGKIKVEKLNGSITYLTLENLPNQAYVDSEDAKLRLELDSEATRAKVKETEIEDKLDSEALKLETKKQDKMTASKGIVINGVNIEHSNSITALDSEKSFVTIKIDENGHISDYTKYEEIVNFDSSAIAITDLTWANAKTIKDKFDGLLYAEDIKIYNDQSGHDKYESILTDETTAPHRTATILHDSKTVKYTANPADTHKGFHVEADEQHKTLKTTLTTYTLADGSIKSYDSGIKLNAPPLELANKKKSVVINNAGDSFVYEERVKDVLIDGISFVDSSDKTIVNIPVSKPLQAQKTSSGWQLGLVLDSQGGIVNNRLGALSINVDNDTVYTTNDGVLKAYGLVKDVQLENVSLLDSSSKIVTISLDNDSVVVNSAGQISATKYTGGEAVEINGITYKVNTLYDDVTVKLGANNKLYVPIDSETIRVVGGVIEARDVKGMGTAGLYKLSELIPIQTTSTNTLVDMDNLNDKIASSLGTFRGAYSDSEGLPTPQATWKNNDYCYLSTKDSSGQMYLNRYKLVIDSASGTDWDKEFQLALSTFTTNQWKALNSGVTDILVNETDSHLRNTIIHVTQADKDKWDSKIGTIVQSANITAVTDPTTQTTTISATDEKTTPIVATSGSVLIGTAGTNEQPGAATGITVANGKDLTTTGTVTANTVKGAVWNDYAEYRLGLADAGRCVIETGDGDLILSTDRLQPAPNIVSDTFGFSIGETDRAKLPIAVSGRVLAYPFEDRRAYKAGDAVCSGPYGTVSIMSREEIINYPDRIVGIVSEIPNYEKWGSGQVLVNGRIWIKVR